MSTVVVFESTRSRSRPATSRGATTSQRPNRSRSDTHSTSVGFSAAIASATSKTSLAAAAACLRSGSSPLSSLTTARLTSRMRCSTGMRGESGSSIRSSGASSRACCRASPRSRNSTARSSSSRRGRQRRATRSTCCGLNSWEAAPVTREVSSWASSMTRKSCSGRTELPCIASMASRAWLVTTSWELRAVSRDRSTKQASKNAHCWPRHSRTGTDTWAHAAAVCVGASSRSPAPSASSSVCTHSRRATTSAPITDAVSAFADRRPSASTSPPRRESCSAPVPSIARCRQA